ncbi:MAG: FAD-binding oxidoreductase [Actinomycetota bacterium]
MTPIEADVVVIGRGIIGAPAARHLAESGHRVVLIGPDEPTDRRASAGPFCSHPDEGRITRIAGRNGPWVVLAARSIERYRDIADRSGIEFHHPRSVVVSFSDADAWAARAAAWGSDARLVDPDHVRETTGIAVPEHQPVMIEGAPAGWINPRRMVAAQTALVEQAGGTVIREAAAGLARVGDGVVADGPFGEVRADRAIVATGAFGAGLFDRRLDVDRRPRTVVMAECAPDDRIPSLILQGPPDDRLEEIYWVPPVPYPDGRIRLKIGGNLRSFEPLDDQDLVDWFRSDGNDTECEALERSLRALLPDVRFGHIARSPCVVTGTPTGLPFIGWVDDRIAAAIGGNGSAAKSGDELGRLAASVVTDSWDSELDPDLFRPRFVD